MRLKALAEIYTMHYFAQLCNLNFVKILLNFFLNSAKCRKIFEIFNESNDAKFDEFCKMSKLFCKI